MSDAKSQSVATVADVSAVSCAVTPSVFGSAKEALYDQVVQKIEAFVRSISEQEAVALLMAGLASSRGRHGGVMVPPSDGNAPTLRGALRAPHASGG